MFPHSEPLSSNASSPAHTLFQLNPIRTNMVSLNTPHNTHFRCEPIFNNTFRDIPHWISSLTTLCITTQNIQCIKPFKDDTKLQGGIDNTVSLQSVTMCLTETSVEWSSNGFRQTYKDAFSKVYQSPRRVFSSSSEISQS
jgi:hypothetical protein